MCKNKVKSKSKSAFCITCGMCAHPSCTDKAANNCRCTASDSTVHTDFDHPDHFWIVENLSGKHDCDVCAKPGSAKERRAGYRCAWCGLQLHRQCAKSLPTLPINQCKFGDLSPAILRPWCIAGIAGHKQVDDWAAANLALEKSSKEPTGAELSKAIALYEGPNVKGKARVLALDGKTRAQAMLVSGLAKFGVDVDKKVAGYYMEEVRYKQRERGAAPSPASTPQGTPKAARKASKKEKMGRGGSSHSLSRGMTGVIGHATMALPPSPAVAMTPLSPGLTSGGGKGPTFKVLSTRKVKKKEKLAKLRATQMTGSPEAGYFALFLRCVAHEHMIQKGTGHVVIHAGAGLSCGRSLHTMQATLRDKVSDTSKETCA